jgi:hypothetical protein
MPRLTADDLGPLLASAATQLDAILDQQMDAYAFGLIEAGISPEELGGVIQRQEAVNRQWLTETLAGLARGLIVELAKPTAQSRDSSR